MPPASTSKEGVRPITRLVEWRGRALAVAAAVAAALIVPSAVLAHASLVEATPSEGAVLRRAPKRVVLRFDEAVSTVPGSVRVFDRQVERVDSGDVEKPSSDSVSVGLRSDLPDGTYVVAWRVISADSHPIRGAYAFSLGEPVGSTADVVEAVLDQEAGSESVDLALAVVRFVGLSLILLCVGGAAVVAFVVDRREAPGSWHWIALAAVGVLLALDSLAWIAFTGVKAAGFGLGETFSWSLSREVLDTTFGKVWAVRALLGLALAIVAAIALRRRRWDAGALLLLLASSIAVTPALAGHARIEGALGVFSDALHVAAAGVWVGGLAFLVLVLVEAGGDRWSLASRIVPRFSTLAVASVVALVTTGVVSGFLEVRSWSALWETTYGRLLLAKVALLIPLVALGAFNNRVSVPRIRQDAESRSRRLFVRTVGVELALMLVIVGVTTALVAEPPARAAAAAKVVSRDGEVGPYDYSLTVDPARAGSNEVHVYLLDSTGQLAPVDEITLSGSLPSADIGPLELELNRAGPGHVTGVSELPLAGEWRVRLGVRKGEFDEWSTVIDIPIRKDS